MTISNCRNGITFRSHKRFSFLWNKIFFLFTNEWMSFFNSLLFSALTFPIKKMNYTPCMNFVKRGELVVLVLIIIIIMKKLETNNKNIQPGYRNRIWHRKIGHAHNEKCTKSNIRRNRTAKFGKTQIDQRKGKYLVLGNIGRGHHQTSTDERKIRKEYLRQTRKLLEPKLCCRNFIKGINTRAISLERYSESFPKWTREEIKQLEQRPYICEVT